MPKRFRGATKELDGLELLDSTATKGAADRIGRWS
jgi:hypothetical protein